LLHFGVKRN